MNKALIIAAICVTALFSLSEVIAQPIKRPYVFTMAGRDTATASVVFPIHTEIAGAKGNVKIDTKGHFVVGDSERIRFFGTELDYTAQFLEPGDARTIARHFQKLGINAVRLNFNDYPYDNNASLILFNGETYAKGSYEPNPAQFAKLDTLLYEFKQAGIYTFFVLRNNHYYYPSDGTDYQDSMWQSGCYSYFVDKRAAELHRNWAKTVLTHVNPLTKTRWGDEPSFAGVEITNNLSLNYGWRFNYLNYIDTNNFLGKGGAQTISFHHSRKLDTLFSQYLLKKYGNDASINYAWKGGGVNNPPNQIANGSFEKSISATWSFAPANGAVGDITLLSPGKDSNRCLLATIESLGANPAAGNAILVNTSARLGKDTLYELSFWAKIKYDPVRDVKMRSILTYLYDFNTYAASIYQFVNIDTNWQQYKITFRSLTTGLQTLYIGLGAQLGDVMFDGFSIKQKDEIGLAPGESALTSRVGRIRFADRPMLPAARFRDVGIFYDSLQRAYFTTMTKCIKDTIKAKVLVNNYNSEWWGTLLDAHVNIGSDYTTTLVNSDYVRPRSGNSFTDSNQLITNNSTLRDGGNYMMGLAASQSIEGKPHIVSYLNPFLNQYYAGSIPFLASYAALQDWDGLFLYRHAIYSENVFSDTIFPSIGTYSQTYYDIAGNPGVLSMFPAVSMMFREGHVKPAETYVPIKHDNDDVYLASYFPDRGSFGVEGYLDPNIVTQYKVRQKFGEAIHRVAATYPYVPDTAAKVSETGELTWAQSSGMLTINADKVAGAIGNVGNDTIKLNAFQFRRLDDARDNLSLLLLPLDSQTVAASSHLLLTAGTRAQNTGMIWWPDSMGILGNWGHPPTVMSAATLEVFVKTDSGRIMVHPLDSRGMRQKTNFFYAQRISPESKIFKIAIDQERDRAVWYEFVMSSTTEAVRRSPEVPSVADMRIMPNPVRERSTILLDLNHSGLVTLRLSNVLGQVVRTVATENLGAGAYEYALDVTALPAGMYVLRAECGGTTLTRNVNVLK